MSSIIPRVAARNLYQLPISVFGNTTSAELAGIITDETGTDKLVFNTSPTFATSVTGSASMDVFNTVSTTVNAFGAATTLNIGAATGTLTLNNAAVKFSAGSVSAPSIYFDADTGSGLYRIGSNNIGFSVSGSKVLDIQKVGLILTGKLEATYQVQNAAANTLPLYSNQTVTITGSYVINNIRCSTYGSISSGITNSASWRGNEINTLRNYYVTGDTGTLSGLYGIYNNYGHFNQDTSTPTTTNAYGLFLQPYGQTGTIGTFYDIYLNSTISGGTVNTHWGVFQVEANNNAFAGNTRFGGVTAPVATVDVTGSLAATTTIKTGGYTVAGLPTPAVGMRTYVTDALAPVFGAVVAAGGAVTIPVFYDGANWIVG